MPLRWTYISPTTQPTSTTTSILIRTRNRHQIVADPGITVIGIDKYLTRRCTKSYSRPRLGMLRTMSWRISHITCIKTTHCSKRNNTIVLCESQLNYECSKSVPGSRPRRSGLWISRPGDRADIARFRSQDGGRHEPHHTQSCLTNTQGVTWEIQDQAISQHTRQDMSEHFATRVGQARRAKRSTTVKRRRAGRLPRRRGTSKVVFSTLQNGGGQSIM